jgi:hypothetical protein
VNATLAILALSLAADPAPPVVVKSEPLPEWDAKLRRADGWVGGDGAFTVRVSESRTLWLFSDTWIGSVRDGKRRDVKMVNNTVGVQLTCGRGGSVKEIIAVEDHDGRPKMRSRRILRSRDGDRVVRG